MNAVSSPMLERLPWAVRPYDARTDLALIAPTWARSSARPPWATEKQHRAHARAAVTWAVAAVPRALVVCSRDVPSTIHAWAIGGPGFVLAAYARPEVLSNKHGRPWWDRLLTDVQELSP